MEIVFALRLRNKHMWILRDNFAKLYTAQQRQQPAIPKWSSQAIQTGRIYDSSFIFSLSEFSDL